MARVVTPWSRFHRRWPGGGRGAASPARGTRHWRAGGTPSPRPAATISEVGKVGDWYGTWASRERRIAAAPLAPAAAGALLGILAVAQTLARTSGAGVAAGPTRLALVVTALATTVPLGLLWSRPALAAPAVTAAAVVSLAAFHTLTVAGLLAQLIALYRLGRRGPAVLAAAAAMPYLVVALVHPLAGAAE